MTAAQFTKALKRLGWTHEVAADKLGVGTRQVVTRWASGKRIVPGYIASALATHLKLKECEEG